MVVSPPLQTQNSYCSDSSIFSLFFKINCEADKHVGLRVCACCKENTSFFSKLIPQSFFPLKLFCFLATDLQVQDLRTIYQTKVDTGLIPDPLGAWQTRKPLRRLLLLTRWMFQRT